MSTKNQKGMSLIELLVAMAIGSFLIIGAVTLQSNTRRSFTVNEQAARLQETARYVMSVLEPEIQLFEQQPPAANQRQPLGLEQRAQTRSSSACISSSLRPK